MRPQLSPVSKRRPRRRENLRRARERGAIAVAMALALVLLQLAVVAFVVSGGHAQNLTVYRIESARAFYAAEAGINMGVREMMNAQDEDGDGTIGSISNDGDGANNPVVGQGTSLLVAKSVNGSTTTLQATAVAGDTARTIEVDVE